MHKDHFPLTTYSDKGFPPGERVLVITNPFLVYRLMRKVTNLPLEDLIGALDAAHATTPHGVVAGRLSEYRDFGVAYRHLVVQATTEIELDENSAFKIDTDHLIRAARSKATAPTVPFGETVKTRSPDYLYDMGDGPCMIVSAEKIALSVQSASGMVGNTPPVVETNLAFVRAHPWFNELGLSRTERIAFSLRLNDQALERRLRGFSTEELIELLKEIPNTDNLAPPLQDPSRLVARLRERMHRKPSTTFAFLLPDTTPVRLLLETFFQVLLDTIANEK